MIKKRRFPEKMSKINRMVEKSCLRHKIPPKVAKTDKMEEIKKGTNRMKMGENQKMRRIG